MPLLTISFFLLEIDIESTDDGYVSMAYPNDAERATFPNDIRVRSPEAGDLEPTFYFYGFVGWDFPANRTEWTLSNATYVTYF